MGASLGARGSARAKIEEASVLSVDIAKLTAVEALAQYRAGTLSPVEVTRAALDRIAALNPRYNAFCLVDEERALADAHASEERWQRGAPIGLIDGVPATIKDLMLSIGWPTMRGSEATDRDQPWNEDTPCVARMREHGAVFLGKTTTPEFGWKGVTECALTGRTLNPWNPERISGGSSGGAAVAAALNMGLLHTSSDGGGSIRMPAGFCGVYGFKPTFGVVPAYPSSPQATMSHQGPTTRTVADAALMLRVMAEPDARDWFALNQTPPDFAKLLEGAEEAVKGLRIAYSRNLGYAEVDSDVRDRVDAAAAVFSELGAEVEEVDPGFESPQEFFELLWSVGLALLVDGIPGEKHDMMDRPIIELAARGRGVSATDYRQAERRREALGQHMALFHTKYDLLLTPQLPLTAFEAGNEVPPGRGMTRWWEWSPFTYPFNLTQQPAATVPCGFGEDGLPVTLQIVGTKYADTRVLRASRAFEAARPFVMPEA